MWVAVSAALLCVAAPASAPAGDWHQGATLVCTDCHSMHNSQAGLPMRYDIPGGPPGDKLLRAEDFNQLCLACHSGGAAGTGPNVRVPTDFDPPGGGFPASLSDPDEIAHSLGGEPVTPPDGTTPVIMACVTCHDPHGNASYRNLRPNPSGDPSRTPAVPVVQQVVTANGINAAAVYVRSNVRYVSGMSQWCLTCHDQIDPTGLSDGSHPVDRAIWGSPHTSWAAWTEPITHRVPVQNATGQPAPHTSDQVFCLSCHKAHGSPHRTMLLKPDGDVVPICSQCHGQ